MRVLGRTRSGNFMRRVAGVSNRGGVFTVYGYGMGIYCTLHASRLFGAPGVSESTCITGIRARGYITYKHYMRCYPTNTIGLNRGLYGGSNSRMRCPGRILPARGG